MMVSKKRKMCLPDCTFQGIRCTGGMGPLERVVGEIGLCGKFAVDAITVVVSFAFNCGIPY